MISLFKFEALLQNCDIRSRLSPVPGHHAAQAGPLRVAPGQPLPLGLSLGGGQNQDRGELGDEGDLISQLFVFSSTTCKVVERYI